MRLLSAALTSHLVTLNQVSEVCQNAFCYRVLTAYLTTWHLTVSLLGICSQS